MSEISKETTEIISESLHLYYEALRVGDLKLLSSIMTEESYFIVLGSFGFKHSFKDEKFRETLKNIENNEESLKKVEKVISADLSNSHREHKIDINKFESNGPERIILHYTEDRHPKKMYYSFSLGEWKIDYKAGRKK
jgi:hypothetical protein